MGLLEGVDLVGCMGGRLQVCGLVLRLVGEMRVLIVSIEVGEVLLGVKSSHDVARGIAPYTGDAGPLILQQYLETSLRE